MATRPRGDLASLALPKDIDLPAAAGGGGGGGSKAYAHTLSLRLTPDGYRRLRRYVAGVEEQSGQRITHQSVIEAALAEYLDRNGG